MLYFALLFSVVLLLCGSSERREARYGLSVAAVLLAWLVGYHSMLFSAFVLAYMGLTYWMHAQPLPRPWLWGRYFLWFLFSAALVLHAVPGYEGLLVVEAQPWKPGAVSTPFYLNTDKVLVAWSLLTWLPLWGRSLPALSRAIPASAPIGLMVLGISVIMGVAVMLRLIDVSLGLPMWFGFFALSNLVNTCIAEELLFRGVVQRWLQQRFNLWLAVLLASVLFGLAHFGGGMAFVLVATLAGLLYGAVYALTGRLWWAIAAHWLLNMVHLVGFTYPMLA
ncbi:CPBP family intramembrane glutamic endopeptidase [Salinispirillum marinum]|uniref:CPBP family intramembrane glutamic endopeptidase n=2 Tax=Saccharospirillaceae TaxID=255527 RepID=A0ABV8BBR0_9GAMM